jgi:hypothetical protein
MSEIIPFSKQIKQNSNKNYSDKDTSNKNTIKNAVEEKLVRRWDLNYCSGYVVYINSRAAWTILMFLSPNINLCFSCTCCLVFGS